MKKRDVQLGATYIVKVSGKLTRVRLTRESPYGGWEGVNLATQRPIHIRSAARLRALAGQYRPRGIDCTTPRRTPAERGITLDTIRSWRAGRKASVTIGEFFLDLGLCPDCFGRGRPKGTESDCIPCHGTGLLRNDPTP